MDQSLHSSQRTTTYIDVLFKSMERYSSDRAQCRSLLVGEDIHRRLGSFRQSAQSQLANVGKIIFAVWYLKD